MNVDWNLAYSITVGGIGLLLLLVLPVLFARTERRRKDAVEQLRRFVAVKTDSDSLDDASGHARDRAVQSIETRFSMLRRLTIPLVVLVTLLLLVAPQLSRVPAAVATLLATAATVVLGIAAKPLLENVIAGVIISFSQPIRIGDVVKIEGRYGIIEQIYLTYTVVKLWDWRRFVIPNSRLLQVDYVNYTIMDKSQWAYLEFWVAHDSDLDLVQQIAEDAVRASPHHVSDQPPGFWIMEVKPEGVLCWIAGWVEHALETWSLRHDIAKALLTDFKKNGIRAHLYHQAIEGSPAPPPLRSVQ